MAEKIEPGKEKRQIEATVIHFPETGQTAVMENDGEGVGRLWCEVPSGGDGINSYEDIVRHAHAEGHVVAFEEEGLLVVSAQWLADTYGLDHVVRRVLGGQPEGTDGGGQ